MYKRVSGWGNTPSSYTEFVSLSPDNSRVPSVTRRGFVPRGLGQSYGDSANNSGGGAINTQLLKFISVDRDKALATVGSGVTINELESECLVHGLFPIVVPGTGRVTIGGAIASDIHGKSHHKVGSISNHLIEFKLLTSDGKIEVLKPIGESSKLFWATVGGMGLTGIIVEATISLLKVETAFVKVKEQRVKNLSDLLKTLLEFNSIYSYTVAWVDLSGKFMGRGIVSGANHAELDLMKNPESISALKPLPLREYKIHYPFSFSIINRTTIRIFNSMWYHKPLGRVFQHVQKYMHPLDSISNWNRIYGKKGFIQYQFVIPLEKADILDAVLSKLRSARCNSFLTVLKSFGDDSEALLGFPTRGLTLAIDLPLNNRNLSNVLRDLDQLILNAGGRIYLTKDSRMSKTHLFAMYPHLEEWKKIKQEVDPENLWQSDQGRRLGLC